MWSRSAAGLLAARGFAAVEGLRRRGLV